MAQNPLPFRQSREYTNLAAHQFSPKNRTKGEGMSAPSIATQRSNNAPNTGANSTKSSHTDKTIPLPSGRQVALRGQVCIDGKRWPRLLLSETCHDIVKACCKKITAELNVSFEPDEDNAEQLNNKAAWVRIRLPQAVITDRLVDAQKLIKFGNIEAEVGTISVREDPGENKLELYFHRRALTGGPKVVPVHLLTVSLTRMPSRFMRIHR